MKFIKKFLFHRITLILIAVLLQITFLTWVIIRFNDSFAYFYGGSILVSIAALLWIINNNSNPAYKIAWIIPILVFPLLGGLFYIFFGGNKLTKREKGKMSSITDKAKEVLPVQQVLWEELSSLSNDAAIQSRYILNSSDYPIYKNTSSKYLKLGEDAYTALMEELKKAEHYIFLEYFIIEEGVMWNSILDVLVEKADKGVDVRVIYDDFGCLMALPYKYNEHLENMGIKCYVFNPLRPIISPRHNHRDHRKIAVIDGHTGFTGGFNLADEYINKKLRFGHWKDTAIMLKGDAVWSMTAMFLSMWSYLAGVDEDFSRFRELSGCNNIDGNAVSRGSGSCGNSCGSSGSGLTESDGFIQPYADSPLDDELVGEVIYLNMINKARKYVYITTPYLIIGNEMVTALTAAAMGGVDIRIITPHVPDKWYVHEVTKSYYKILLESGVKIYEYTPGFMHSKTFISDDEYGVVGSVNLDYRSMFLQFECGVWMYGSSSIGDIKQDFESTLEISRQVTLEDYKSIKWYKALAGSFLRIFAPLM